MFVSIVACTGSFILQISSWTYWRTKYFQRLVVPHSLKNKPHMFSSGIFYMKLKVLECHMNSVQHNMFLHLKVVGWKSEWVMCWVSSLELRASLLWDSMMLPWTSMIRIPTRQHLLAASLSLCQHNTTQAMMSSKRSSFSACLTMEVLVCIRSGTMSLVYVYGPWCCVRRRVICTWHCIIILPYRHRYM